MKQSPGPSESELTAQAEAGRLGCQPGTRGTLSNAWGSLLAEALNQIRSRQASVMCLISIEPRVGVNHCSPCTCRVADTTRRAWGRAVREDQLGARRSHLQGDRLVRVHHELDLRLHLHH